VQTRVSDAFKRAVLVAIVLAACAVMARGFPRDELIEDARQLAAIIEESHPDPVLRCGGRIAFYRALQDALEAIPEEGMSKEGFFAPSLQRSVTPTRRSGVATVLATSIRAGSPLRFGIVEPSLYVTGMRPEEERLRSARLISVEGRTLADLMAVRRTLVGIENDYEVLLRLSEQSLWYEPYLQELLPDWEKRWGQVFIFESA